VWLTQVVAGQVIRLPVVAQDVHISQSMAPLKQDTDVKARITLVSGSVLLASLLFPAVRRALTGGGSLTLGLILILAIGLLGFGIFRMKNRPGNVPTDNENPFAASDADSEPAWNEDESGASLESFGPVLRRRYPWRHRT